jgi:hypothetical protein
MKSQDNIVVEKEVEETFRREAEVVEATGFQSVTSEFESRHDDKKMNNWFKDNCTTNVIAGRAIARLSVQHLVS